MARWFLTRSRVSRSPRLLRPCDQRRESPPGTSPRPRVGSSLRAVISPRTWWASPRATPMVIRAASLRATMGFGEEHLGLPADVLIDPDGRVLAAKYGRYANDQWSVDEVLDLARDR